MADNITTNYEISTDHGIPSTMYHVDSPNRYSSGYGSGYDTSSLSTNSTPSETKLQPEESLEVSMRCAKISSTKKFVGRSVWDESPEESLAVSMRCAKISSTNRFVGRSFCEESLSICTKDQDVFNKILEYKGFGLFTIIIMHKQKEYSDYLRRILLSMILVAQWFIPIVLFIISQNNYDDGYCPNSGPVTSRVLNCLIGLVYASRLFVVFNLKWKKSEVWKKDIMEIKELPLKSLYIFCMKFDDFMNIAYEGGVYMLNLVIIFRTEEPIEIVLNALAMEFIMKLDDEVVEAYIHEADIYKNETENLIYLDSLIKRWYLGEPEDGFMDRTNKKVVYLMPIASFMFAMYAPFCTL